MNLYLKVSQSKTQEHQKVLPILDIMLVKLGSHASKKLTPEDAKRS